MRSAGRYDGGSGSGSTSEDGSDPEAKTEAKTETNTETKTERIRPQVGSFSGVIVVGDLIDGYIHDTCERPP